MNVHDSERLSGLLEDAGYVARRPTASSADVVVFNTCAVRENADNKLYGNLGHLAPVKAAAPGHADRGRRLPGAEGPGEIVEKAPWVDVVFGTHNIGSLPVLLERARVTTRRRRSRSSSRSRSSRRRCRPGASRPTPPGCRSRSAATTPAPSASCRRCAARRRTAGPATSSPRSRRWSPRASSRSPCSARTSTRTASSSATGRRSASCCAPAARSRGWSGCASPRPHPADFTDDVIAAMAETPNVMPQLHMPLQSGSDAVLQGDAPVVPAGEVPRHHRPGPRGDARRRDHHRHHRRLPRRDRGGLPGDPGRGARGAVRRRLHLPVLQAPRHARRDDGRPGAAPRSSRSATSGWSTLVKEIAWAENQRLVGRQRRGAGRRGRGPQGRRHPPAVRPRPRQPAGALHPGPREVEVGRGPSGPATWSPSRSPTRRRTTWSPTGRCSPLRRTRAGDAWEARTAAPVRPGRRARHADRRACR